MDCGRLAAAVRSWKPCCRGGELQHLRATQFNNRSFPKKPNITRANRLPADPHRPSTTKATTHPPIKFHTSKPTKKQSTNSLKISRRDTKKKQSIPHSPLPALAKQSPHKTPPNITPKISPPPHEPTTTKDRPPPRHPQATKPKSHFSKNRNFAKLTHKTSPPPPPNPPPPNPIFFIIPTLTLGSPDRLLNSPKSLTIYSQNSCQQFVNSIRISPPLGIKSLISPDNP